MTDTETVEVTKPRRKPIRDWSCGFCQTGAHDKCVTAIRNGDGSIVKCRCCLTKPPRCLECSNRRASEVSEETRLCLDRDACLDTREASRASGPAGKFLRARERAMRVDRPDPSYTQTGTDTTPRTPSTAKPLVGLCRCCGGATKGGAFLPGHDSRYLSRLVEQVKTGDLIGHDALAMLADKPALQAKLEKRL